MAKKVAEKGTTMGFVGSGTKTYLEALRCLPDEYVADDTGVHAILAKGFILAYNPRLGTMVYQADKNAWVKVRMIKPIKLTKPPAPAKIKDN